MKLLITSANTDLAQQLAFSLSTDHQIRLTDVVDCQTDFDFYCSGLDHESQLPVQHIDSVVHLAKLPSTSIALNGITDTANQRLDFSTRCTYNLLKASVENGVSNFVFVSTLGLFNKFGQDVAIGPRWRPRPTTDPDLLAPYLGECVCREFAREGVIKITILRLGQVHIRAIASAVSEATINKQNWQIVHLGEQE